MATGVSLKGSDAALVLLRQAAGEYVSMSLAIKGNYNRLGSIDGIVEDANTRLVLRFFLASLRSGAFRVDEAYLASHRCFPIRTTEDLLQACERNMNDGPGHAVLHGQPVVFALIARAVWETIAQAARPPDEPVSAVFRRLFGSSPVGGAIYAGSLAEVSGHVGEFAAVDAFLRSHGLAWQPSKAAGQDYPEEMRQYLAEARQAFADSPIIRAALRRYEEEVAELLEDE
jgi:hypothetical protein